MINVYLNKEGYYIYGPSTESFMQCQPSIDQEGLELHTLYIILAKALNEFRGYCVNDDIIVYNDSRIIDELNGNIRSLDDLSLDILLSIRRNILPEISSNVFFKKINSRIIDQKIHNGRARLISDKKPMFEKPSLIKQKALKKLKEKWYAQ